MCGQKQERSIGSVLQDFRILVFCCQFQFLLSLQVAIASHGAQVATVHRQQHHGRRKGSVADVSQALSGDHGGDPERTIESSVTRDENLTIHSLRDTDIARQQ